MVGVSPYLVPTHHHTIHSCHYPPSYPPSCLYSPSYTMSLTMNLKRGLLPCAWRKPCKLPMQRAQSSSLVLLMMAHLLVGGHVHVMHKPGKGGFVRSWVASATAGGRGVFFSTGACVRAGTGPRVSAALVTGPAQLRFCTGGCPTAGPTTAATLLADLRRLGC